MGRNKPGVACQEPYEQKFGMATRLLRGKSEPTAV